MAEKDKTDLPKWMTVEKDGAITVDPNGFYPELLEAAGAPDEPDQYWLEVAHQMMKLEVTRAISGTKHDPRPDRALIIKVRSDGDRKETWRQANYKAVSPQRMAEATTREGRAAYQRWRGSIPA